MTETIKIILLKRKMTGKELAKRLGYTPQNLSSKFRKDNFTVKELAEIAEVLNCTFDISFTMRDTGEKI